LTVHDLSAAVKASSRFSFLIDVISLHQHQDARELPIIAPEPAPTRFAWQPMPELRQVATDRDTHEYAEARAAPLGGALIAPYSVPTTFAPQPMPVLRQGATDRETHEYAESRAVPLDGVPRQRSLSDTSAWVVELFRRP